MALIPLVDLSEVQVAAEVIERDLEKQQTADYQGRAAHTIGSGAVVVLVALQLTANQ